MSELRINKTEKPNSWEFGKAGNRWKLYFENSEDLKKMIDELVKAGFEVEDIVSK